MINSAKENTQDDEFDDEEEFVLKKEASASATTHQGIFDIFRIESYSYLL